MLSRGAQILHQRQRQFTCTTLSIYRRVSSREQMSSGFPLQQLLTCHTTSLEQWQRLKGCCYHNSFRDYSSDDKKSQYTNKTNNSKATFPAKEESPITNTNPSTKQTKNFEIQTSKGVLSITTTIEDSKINDIVFEKTEVPTTSTANVTTTPKVVAVPTALAGAPATASVHPIPSASLPTMPPELTLKVQTIEQSTKSSSNVESVTSKIIPKFLQPKESLVTANVEAAKAAIAEPIATPKPKRPRFDSNRSSLERNFITPARAMADFMLKAADLENLPKIKRRSPYEQEPPITVFWRRDVEAKAIEMWGSRENLLKEVLKRECERKQHQQMVQSADIFTVKRRLRDYRREIGAHILKPSDQERGLSGKSGKVVLTAIAINGTNFVVKLGGWIYSGSHSMFAECIHSLADMVNQIILAYGIHKSVQTPDLEHPYGYTYMKYVSALISGVGIFCVGCGVSIYHGITGIYHPEPMQDLFWAYFILGGTVCSEGATLIVAINELRRAAKEHQMTFKEYVVSGQDPCVNVVLTEDAAAVAGVLVAASCMGLSTYTGSPLYDAIGSLLVGGILGGVASFIIYTNVQALVGKSIQPAFLERINVCLESDVMIRAIHDVKGLDMGNALVRYKAEVDFDGRELTRSYLDKQDLNALLQTVKSFQSVEELETFILDHGENIVDLMGGEIDRIEMNLRNQFPEIRHCDLEIL